jgi:hypothetical protein
MKTFEVKESCRCRKSRIRGEGFFGGKDKWAIERFEIVGMLIEASE